MHNVIGRCLDRLKKRGTGYFITKDHPYTVEARLDDTGHFRSIRVAKRGGEIVSVDLDTERLKCRVNDRVDRQVVNTVLSQLYIALYVSHRVPLTDDTFMNITPFLEAHLDDGETIVSKQLGKLFLKGGARPRYIMSSSGKIPRYQLINV